MYNVQLSEFWKQRCTKESVHNAPYLFDEDNDDTVSEAPSRAISQLSTTSTVTQQKIEELQKKLEAERAYASSPRPLPPQPSAHPRLQQILLLDIAESACSPSIFLLPTCGHLLFGSQEADRGRADACKLPARQAVSAPPLRLSASAGYDIAGALPPVNPSPRVWIAGSGRIGGWGMRTAGLEGLEE